MKNWFFILLKRYDVGPHVSFSEYNLYRNCTKAFRNYKSEEIQGLTHVIGRISYVKTNFTLNETFSFLEVFDSYKEMDANISLWCLEIHQWVSDFVEHVEIEEEERNQINISKYTYLIGV